MQNNHRIKFDRIEITGVTPELKEKLIQKAKKKGETLSKITKSLLREWLNR